MTDEIGQIFTSHSTYVFTTGEYWTVMAEFRYMYLKNALHWSTLIFKFPIQKKLHGIMKKQSKNIVSKLILHEYSSPTFQMQVLCGPITWPVSIWNEIFQQI